MWMEWGCALRSVGLHSLACLAPTNIAIGILHHVHPPVNFQQSCFQLPWPRVSSCGEVMLKPEDCLTGFFRYPRDPSLLPESHSVSHPLIIKPLWLLYMHRTIFLE